MDDSLIHNLAVARQELQSVKDGIAMLKRIFESSPEYQGLQTDLALKEQHEAEAITAVNDAAFAEWEANRDNIHPHSVVTIKTFTDYNIIDDPDKVEKFCFEEFHKGLTLDYKVLESAAKNGLLDDRLYEVKERHQAQISKDLSGYINLAAT
jgi:hypothetical protein